MASLSFGSAHALAGAIEPGRGVRVGFAAGPALRAYVLGADAHGVLLRVPTGRKSAEGEPVVADSYIPWPQITFISPLPPEETVI